MPVIDWTRMPSLTALRAFEATAGTRSFSAAARTLNVTHAAVAQQVKALEEHLGVVLMTRSPRGIALTDDGERLARRLADGFGAIADGVEALADRAAARPVRVTTTNFFAESVIFPRIAEFWVENPGLEVSFTPTDRAVDLVGEGYDLGVRAGSGDWPSLHPQLLFESGMIVCAAPALVDDPATDWTRVPWLLPGGDSWEIQALRDSGIDPDAIERKDIGDTGQEMVACEQGLGLILESEVDLRPRIAAGRLKVAPIPIRFTAGWYAVTPTAHPRQSVRRLRAWMARICAEL